MPSRAECTRAKTPHGTRIAVDVWHDDRRGRARDRYVTRRCPGSSADSSQEDPCLRVIASCPGRSRWTRNSRAISRALEFRKSRRFRHHLREVDTLRLPEPTRSDRVPARRVPASCITSWGPELHHPLTQPGAHRHRGIAKALRSTPALRSSAARHHDATVTAAATADPRRPSRAALDRGIRHPTDRNKVIARSDRGCGNLDLRRLQHFFERAACLYHSLTPGLA